MKDLFVRSMAKDSIKISYYTVFVEDEVFGQDFYDGFLVNNIQLNLS